MIGLLARTGLACGALVVVAVLAAACGGQWREGGSREGEVAAAIDFLDKGGLHGMDESINTRKEVPANARATLLHLQAVTKLTDWPGDFDDAAEDLARTFGELAALLESDNPDLAKAGELAKKAHDDQHDFSHDVWEWLMDESEIDSGSEEDSH